MDDDELSYWQKEKIPLDVWTLVLGHLYEKDCPVCSKTLIYEVKNYSCCVFMRVCRRWRLAWVRCIKYELRNKQWRFCSNPPKCLKIYSRKCGKLPFLVLSPDLKVSLHNTKGRVRAQIAESGEPSVRSDELSALNKPRS